MQGIFPDGVWAQTWRSTDTPFEMYRPIASFHAHPLHRHPSQPIPFPSAPAHSNALRPTPKQTDIHLPLCLVFHPIHRLLYRSFPALSLVHRQLVFLQFLSSHVRLPFQLLVATVLTASNTQTCCNRFDAQCWSLLVLLHRNVRSLPSFFPRRLPAAHPLLCSTALFETQVSSIHNPEGKKSYS